MEEEQMTMVARSGLFPTDPTSRGDNTAYPWYSNYGNLVRVAEFLVAQGGDNGSAEALLRFLRQPWRYAHVWTRMREHEKAPR